jgi:4-carboxymuconolactone decarboxylase
MTEQRLHAPADDTLSEAQRRVVAAMTTGPRGAVVGPYFPLLHSPELCQRVQHLGAYIRFQNILPAALKELAILVVARHWTAQFEWYAHRRLALEAGLAASICDAIADDRRPAGMSADETMIYEFSVELVETKQVGDANYETVRARFGEQGVMDLVGTLGFYGLISMVLNTARVPLPEGETPLAPRAR